MEGTAYAEIWTILQQLEENDRNKIPREILEKIDANRNKDYNADINLEIPLQEQKLSEKAVEMLCYLEMEYLSTPEQREELIKAYKQNEQRISQELDVHRIFEERKKAMVPVVIKEEYTWYQKIWNKIKSFLGKVLKETTENR